MKAGSAIASKAPDRIRRAARAVKLREAAWHISRAPHMKMLKDRYQAGGQRCMMRLDGMDQKSQPK